MKRRAAAVSGLFSVVALTLAACGPAPEPQQPVSTPGTATGNAPAGDAPQGPTGQFDPVPQGLTVAGVKQVCDEHLAAATKILERIKTQKGAPAASLTYASTLRAFDDAAFEVSKASLFPYLLAVSHPDEAVREAAKLCEPRADKFNTALYLDADLAQVIRAYAAKNESLDVEQKRLLADILRDFRRNGLELSPEKQTRLRQINEQITTIGQRFESNIASSVGKIRIKPRQLAGLPPDFVTKHPPKADGFVEVTTDYPDYYPFITYATDRKAALDLYVLFTNRGGDDNVKLLEELLRLRSEKAQMLGYASWADYAIEPRMAKSAKTVKDFLDRIRASLKEPGSVEMAELMKEHVAHGGGAKDRLPPVERYYLSDQVRLKKYAFDSKELTKYFEVSAVTQGLLDITARMYGLEYKKVDAPVWHPDVTAYDAVSKGKVIGRFYLDLYSRPDKYKHAAMFAITTGKRLADGSYQKPTAALECNFPKPGGATPALMLHEDAKTFFHEFGHVLHHLLTESELASYSGTSTVRDFVEAPSQMFEEWVWNREVLDLFAKHHQTGAKIPDALFAGMTKARRFGRALDAQRQVYLATLDLEYHLRKPPFDTTQLGEDIQTRTDSFAFVKGTHFQSSFGHLIGYDAGYYSYQWALSLSRDALTRFKKEGFLNPVTAAAWREDVLAKGGGLDERGLVTKFLGREPGDEAYIAYLTGRD